MKTLDKNQLPTSLLKYYNSTRSNSIRENIFDVYEYFLEIFENLDQNKTPSTESINLFFDLFIQDKKLPEYADINKFLFGKKEVPVISIKEEVKEIPSFSELPLVDNTIQINDDEITSLFSDNKNLKNEIQSLKDNIKYYQDLHTQQMRILKEKQMLQNNFVKEAFVLNIRKQIQIITENTEEFTNIYFDSKNKIIHMVCRKPCELKFGKTIKSFGYYALCIDILKSRIYATPFLKNISNGYEGAYHPHVYDSGEICLGTASEMIVECFAKFELAKIAEIASLILHNYNKDSPVNEFESFTEEYYFSNLTDYVEMKFIHKDYTSIKKKAA